MSVLPQATLHFDSREDIHAPCFSLRMNDGQAEEDDEEGAEPNGVRDTGPIESRTFYTSR